MLRILLFALLGTMTSCALTAAGKPMGDLAPEINSTRIVGELVLVPGDVLSVRFPRKESWDQSDLIIDPNGNVAFLALDSIHVAGLTLKMLDEKLTEEYTKILADPELTVQTTTLAPRTIIVMGEVVDGGEIELPADRLTLLEAIGKAKGFIRDTAQLDHVMLVRWMPEENRVRAWKIDAGVDRWDAEESILLQAHDVLFIPAKPIVDVNDWVDRYLRRNIPLPFIPLAP